MQLAVCLSLGTLHSCGFQAFELGTGKCILQVNPHNLQEEPLHLKTFSKRNVRNIIFKRAGWGVELVTSQVYTCVYIYTNICVCTYLFISVSIWYCICFLILALIHLSPKPMKPKKEVSWRQGQPESPQTVKPQVFLWDIGHVGLRWWTRSRRWLEGGKPRWDQEKTGSIEQPSETS